MQTTTNQHVGAEGKSVIALRDATRTMHVALEQTALSRSIMDDRCTVEDYTRYLGAMRQVMAFTEQHVFPWLKNIIKDLDERYKLPLIDKDLKWLNNLRPPLPCEFEFTPAIDTMDTGFALGFMYVTEGSTLGGVYILKQLRNRLGIDDMNGGAFLSAYGNNTRKRWNDFLYVLENHTDNDLIRGKAIEGAICAFSSIRNFFEGIPVNKEMNKDTLL